MSDRSEQSSFAALKARRRLLGDRTAKLSLSRISLVRYFLMLALVFSSANSSAGIAFFQRFLKQVLSSSTSGQAWWTWMSGANTTGASATYGAKGVSSSLNVPGSRYGATTMTDSSGNLWLFGGISSGNYYNDLWKYVPATREWTWMSGATAFIIPG